MRADRFPQSSLNLCHPSVFESLSEVRITHVLPRPFAWPLTKRRN